MNDFEEVVDGWIKDLDRRVNYSKDTLIELLKITDGNVNNIQHNYELIKGMEADLDLMKKELKLYRQVLLVLLKRIRNGELNKK